MADTNSEHAPAPEGSPADQEAPSHTSVWFYAEHRDGKLEESALKLACEARVLADKFGGEVFAILVGAADLQVLPAELGPYGTDNAFIIQDAHLDAYKGETYSDVLAQLAAAGEPATVLFASTAVGTDLAPRLAARLRAAYAARYTDIDVANDGTITVRRPVHGGNAHSTAPLLKKPLVATIDTQTLSVQKAKAPAATCTIEPRIAISPRATKTRTVDFLRADPCAVCVSEAEVVIGIGKGMGHIDNLGAVEELARLLGASIGGSRRATDERWIADERRIGLTGKTISPRLYLICGISGAFHHTLSIKGSQLKVVINTDEKAPISKMADLMIVGDMQKIVPELTKQLRDVAKSTS